MITTGTSATPCEDPRDGAQGTTPNRARVTETHAGTQARVSGEAPHAKAAPNIKGSRAQSVSVTRCCYSEYLAYAESATSQQGEGTCECATMRTMEMLSGKWRLKVLFQLTLHDSMRFSELKRSIPGITSAMLTTALRELSGYGVVIRRQFEEIPPRVEYSLTEAGRNLYPIFYEVARWSDTYLS
jgi:DNA-binding HxlR family transcriptional regulator